MDLLVNDLLLVSAVTNMSDRCCRPEHVYSTSMWAFCLVSIDCYKMSFYLFRLSVHLCMCPDGGIPDSLPSTSS